MLALSFKNTDEIANINKKEWKVIEREVVIAFKNSVCREILTLDPKKVS
jgi:hypothetical protein